MKTLHPEYEPFALGFAFGARNELSLSDRQIEQKYPNWTYEQRRQYGEGLKDGMAGDRFRLNLLYKQYQEEVR